MDDVLLLGDRELASLSFEGIDGFWVYGTIKPGPAYSEIGALFERLEKAWACGQSDGARPTGPSEDPLQIQEIVNGLGLEVRTASGRTQKVLDFKVHNGEYEYKVDIA